MNSNLVFVIDDDPSIRKGLARLLRLANYETEVFESASDFLARPQHPGRLPRRTPESALGRGRRKQRTDGQR